MDFLWPGQVVKGSFLVWSSGQRFFFGVVKWSRDKFSGQKILTPVAGLSTAHIGVTIP